MASDYRGRSDIHTLGIINNNVGNIRPLSVGTWLGQVGTNEGFVVFESMDWGIRAWLQNFYSSIKNHGTDTLRKYITRYAPPSENDTAGYINYMVEQTGIGADDVMPLDKDSITSIMIAQWKMEQGADKVDKYITQADIDSGFNLLDSKLASFFNALKIMSSAYPVQLYGASAALLIGAGALTMVAVRLMRKRK